MHSQCAHIAGSACLMMPEQRAPCNLTDGWRPRPRRGPEWLRGAQSQSQCSECMMCNDVATEYSEQLTGRPAMRDQRREKNKGENATSADLRFHDFLPSSRSIVQQNGRRNEGERQEPAARRQDPPLGAAVHVGRSTLISLLTARSADNGNATIPEELVNRYASMFSSGRRMEYAVRDVLTMQMRTLS